MARRGGTIPPEPGDRQGTTPAGSTGISFVVNPLHGFGLWTLAPSQALCEAWNFSLSLNNSAWSLALSG